MYFHFSNRSKSHFLKNAIQATVNGCDLNSPPGGVTTLVFTLVSNVSETKRHNRVLPLAAERMLKDVVKVCFCLM